MKQWKDNSWEEEDGRDDRASFKLEKKIWKEMFPHIAKILKAQEEQDEDVE